MVTSNDKLNGLRYELKGKSTDTKPTDVEVNSLFFELDTSDFYFFDEDKTWKKVGGDA